MHCRNAPGRRKPTLIGGRREGGEEGRVLEEEPKGGKNSYQLTPRLRQNFFAFLFKVYLRLDVSILVYHLEVFLQRRTAHVVEMKPALSELKVLFSRSFSLNPKCTVRCTVNTWCFQVF